MSDSDTPWTVAHQAPLPMEFCRQEYQGGLPLPSPGDLSDSGIKRGFPAFQTDSILSEPQGKSTDVSFMGYYKILSVVSCAIPYVLVVYI